MSKSRRSDDDGAESTPMRDSGDRPEPQPRGQGTSIYQNKESSRKKNLLLRRLKIATALLTTIVVILVVGIIVTYVGTKAKYSGIETKKGNTEKLMEKNKALPKVCKSVVKAVSSSNRGQKIFSGLSLKETEEVVKFMRRQTKLKLKPAANATLRDNYIYTIEDHMPNKKDVTDWLDNKKRQPTRQAKVIVFFGEARKVAEYIVSPIPRPNKLRQVNTRRQDEELKWKSRPVCNNVEAKVIYTYVMKQLNTIQGIIMRSFAPSGCEQMAECFYMNMAPRAIPNSPDRHIVVWFFVSPLHIHDYYMYPLPLYLVLSTPANGYSYQIKNIYYNKVEFQSLESLKTDYHSHKVTHYKLPNLDAHRGVYGSPKYVKDGYSADQQQKPPQQFYPQGQRFSVSGTHVEWLGWAFDMHARTISGMQIFDLNFKKERIAYELSMQDILVLYSGAAPDDFFKNYFDNGWSTGRYNLPVIRGVDCPSDAAYLNSSVYGISQDRGIILKDAICVFEHRNSVPLRRHYSSDFFQWGYRYAFSMPDSVLIVRQIISVWNYDYVFDYEFHQNGAVEVKVSSTGYVAVSNNIDPRKIDHGYLIHPEWESVANLHQHMFNFKLDLDIGGVKNNFKTVDVVSRRDVVLGAKKEPWYQMVMGETKINSESKSALRYNFEEPKLYVMYNDDKELYANTNGSQKRAYRIQSNSFAKVVLPDTSPLLSGGASWTKYQLVVTKHNENERTTASHFVQGDPFQPDINFDSFLNDDSLDDVDLVAWVTVGLHHVPSYEDLPVTTTTGKVLSIMLAPFNYFKRDPSIHSRDAAVFWNKSFNTTNDYLSLNNTCLPTNEDPVITP